MTGPGDGPPPLAAFNALSAAECAALLAPVCEHAPDLTAPLAALRPFESVTALHAALERALAAAPEARILDFLNAHPELTAAHRAMRLTAESAGEQAAAGLDALAADAAARLAELNAAYRRRHGFPFILAVRHAGPATVLAGLAHRLERPTAVERAAALEEIGAIVWMRLLERVAPAPTGAIAVAATDRARGAPAAGAPAALWRIGEDGAETALDAGALDARGRRELLAGAA
ncbi:MAG: 2-oxo-4-hydroxy-4-carboxy-5-ureidoimidazoline decarboxylase, partial [Pseudomonadota bacterium]